MDGRPLSMCCVRITWSIQAPSQCLRCISLPVLQSSIFPMRCIVWSTVHPWRKDTHRTITSHLCTLMSCPFYPTFEEGRVQAIHFQLCMLDSKYVLAFGRKRLHLVKMQARIYRVSRSSWQVLRIAQSSAQVEAFNAGSMGYQIPLQPPSQSFAPQVVQVPVSPFDSSSS